MSRPQQGLILVKVGSGGQSQEGKAGADSAGAGSVGAGSAGASNKPNLGEEAEHRFWLE